MESSTHFRVRHVEVTGAKVLQSDAIRELANVRLQQSMFGLPFDDIANRIIRNPWVQAVNVKRRLPDTVELEIIERTPVAALRGRRLMVLTADGMAVQPPSEDWMWDLPILSPPRNVTLESGSSVKNEAVLSLLRQTVIARKCAPLAWRSMSELYFSQGAIHAVLDKPRMEVLLGDDADELAWIGLQRFVEQMTEENSGHFTRIDMRIPGKLVVSVGTKETAEYDIG